MNYIQASLRLRLLVKERQRRDRVRGTAALSRLSSSWRRCSSAHDHSLIRNVVELDVNGSAKSVEVSGAEPHAPGPSP